tara:strand:+ start:2159 stop:3760 length:1602 start_codon:yes stop_codon:yes gene_type:complete
MEEEKENLHKKITDLEEENLKLKMQLQEKSSTNIISELVNESDANPGPVPDSDTYNNFDSDTIFDSDSDSDSDSHSFIDNNINNECPEKIKDFCSNYKSLTIIVNLINSENIKIIDENNNLEKLKILFNKNNNINNKPQFGGGFFNDLLNNTKSIISNTFKDYKNEFNINLKLLLETPDVINYENINNNNIIIEFLKSFHFQKDEKLENFSVINYYHLLKESNNLLKLNTIEYTNYLKNNDYSNFKLLLLENYVYDFEIENNSFKLLSFLKINTYYNINKKIIQLLEYYFKETSSLLNHKYIKIDTSDTSDTSDTGDTSYTSDTSHNFIITYQNSLSEKCDEIINHIYNETFEIFKIIKKYVSKNVKNLLDYDYKKNLYIENGKEYIKIDALKFDIPPHVNLNIDEEIHTEEPHEEPDEEPDEEKDEEKDEEPDEEKDEEPDEEKDEEPSEEPDEEKHEEPSEEDLPKDTKTLLNEEDLPKEQEIAPSNPELTSEKSKELPKITPENSEKLSKHSEKKEMLGGKNKKTRKTRY